MGYSLSWTAVRGKPPELVLAAFELRPTGKTTDLPVRKTPFCWTKLDGGWVLVLASPSGLLEAAKALVKMSTKAMSSWHDKRFIDESGAADGFLLSLSAGCELVCCFVEEHVMFSRATAWKDGVQRWSVLHDAQVEVDHLRVDGTPPSSLAEIEAAARAEQQAEPEGVDFLFDVPVNLAKAVTSFRHDEGELELEALEPLENRELTPDRKRSLFGRLFGR